MPERDANVGLRRAARRWRYRRISAVIASAGVWPSRLVTLQVRGRRTGRRGLVDLDSEEALILLSGAAFGRVVFTHRALPEIRLVNHILDDGLIIIRTRPVTRLATAVADQLPYPTVVAYQADEIDPVTRTGWSVVATGVARPVSDPERVARYEQMLRPWVGQRMDSVVAIEPQLVVGFRLEVAGDP